MKHTLIYLLGLFLACSLNLHAQEVVNKDSIVADFNYLVEQLEATHPDPYTGFGGKVFFHQKAFELKNDLRQNSYTINEFADKVKIFLANIQDGHTFLEGPKGDSNKMKFFYPVAGRVIPGGLIIGVTNKELAPYLGYRILQLNGVPVDSLLDKVGAKTACENIYGKYAALAPAIGRKEFVASISPDYKDRLILSLEAPDGKLMDLEFPLLSIEEVRNNPSYYQIQSDSWSEMPEGYMSYKFVDNSKQVMLFKLASVMAHENFEYQFEQGWDGTYDQLSNFYKWTLKKEMPVDTAQALKEIPSFSETFLSMLQEMKKEGSKTLIVDLRGNGGGWTPITLPSLYLLFGDRYLQTDMDSHFYRLLSPLYLKKTNQTLEAFNKMYEANYKLGDYLLENDEEESDTMSVQQRRRQFIDNCMSDTKSALEVQEGQPFYTPAKVYVVTNSWTFSAAFHYAFYLWKMGAVVVGVPSRQAPNTFMEMTPFQLPYTRLNGSISNAMQVFLPGGDNRAKVFWPDIMLDYQDYKKYNFNLDAELMYLLTE